MNWRRRLRSDTGWRLQSKLLAGILVVEMLLFVPFILIVEYQLRSSMLSEFEKHGLSVTRSLAVVNSDFLATYDYVKMDQHLQQSLDDPQLLHAAVLMFDGEVASQIVRDGVDPVALDGADRQNVPPDREQIEKYRHNGAEIAYEFTVPIAGGDTFWGAVRTRFSLDSVNRAIAGMRGAVFGLGLLGLAVAYLASVLLSRRIVLPIKTLVGNVQAIASGRYDQPIRISSNDEIGYLGRQFSAMQATVKQQLELVAAKNNELLESNRSLVYEVDERQRKEIELRASEARLANAQRIAKLGFWEWREGEREAIWSAELGVMLGSRAGAAGKRPYRDLVRAVPRDDRAALKQAVRQVISGGGRCSVEHRVKSATGEIIFVQHELEAGGLAGSGPLVIVGTLQDVTERKKAEDRIRHLAHYDSITGLPNRRHLQDLLALWVKRAARSHKAIAVMFLDIDHFKRINDTLGHSAGDALLRQVSERLAQCVRGGDPLSRGEGAHGDRSIARLGGDEFVIVLEDIKGPSDAAAVAGRVRTAFDRPFPLLSTEVVVTPSIGISCFPKDGTDVDELLKNADTAMYHAKEQGRNNYQFFDASMNALMHERLTLESCLRDSLGKDHFELVYQPKIDAKTGSTIGMEALMRWHHPELGFISPGKFIPIAEETGIIVPLGEWALRTACTQLGHWQRAGMPALCVAVNLSAAQFREPRLAEIVDRTLRETGLSPQCLELELTESMLIDQVDATVAKLHSLKKLGVTLSIDDFGTGYSSLSYLKRFPIDTLKIDQSFIRDLANDESDATIVSATIALGHKLGLNVVAEGVEDQVQYDFLRAQGCDHIQGYFFSKPLSAEAFQQYCARDNSPVEYDQLPA